MVTVAGTPLPSVPILQRPWLPTLPQLPAVALSEAQSRAMSYGQGVMVDAVALGQLRLYDASGRFLGLGTGTAEGLVRPQRLFASTNSGP